MARRLSLPLLTAVQLNAAPRCSVIPNGSPRSSAAAFHRRHDVLARTDLHRVPVVDGRLVVEEVVVVHRLRHEVPGTGRRRTGPSVAAGRTARPSTAVRRPCSRTRTGGRSAQVITVLIAALPGTCSARTSRRTVAPTVAPSATRCRASRRGTSQGIRTWPGTRRLHRTAPVAPRQRSDADRPAYSGRSRGDLLVGHLVVGLLLDLEVALQAGAVQTLHVGVPLGVDVLRAGDEGQLVLL